MITASKDHTLFFEAYNDASDINGDGVLDIGFKPNIVYYGLFDSNLCYTHNNASNDTGLFEASGKTANGKCAGKWSGNWLNYATTSRIDALRKVLYGGHRDTDTESLTVLRRAYIPQDAHSWAKEYTSIAVDGYDISDYTPYPLPTGGNRHFFGNVTMNGSTNCATLNNCSNLPPLLSIVTNSNKRVWEWASSERLVLGSAHGGSKRDDRTVRVKVCNEPYTDGCKRYANGSYKPVGLLHDYGENDSMLFGLLTGSYNKNMSGGVLRKVVSSFSNEVNQTTGQFTANATIVTNLNNLRIRDFNNGRSDGFYRNGSYRTGIMPEGNYVDWGNPVAEMLYESVRYFAGKKTPTSIFNTSGSHDAAVGLTVATWDSPFESSSAAKAPWCAKPNILLISSSNVSYDSDQLPGADPAFSSGFTGDLSGLNVSTLGQKIANNESGVKGPKFIGAVGSNEDYAPTVKNVTSLGNIRGLPEEPTKQGSYYSASVAHFAKINDLNSSLEGSQTIDTFVVALASPLPKLEFTVGGKKISLVPFAKTINGASTDRNKGKYQPTDPIVDFYVEEYSATRVKLRINYEADEQGNDYDMDVVVLYEIEVKPNNTLEIKTTPIYQSTGSNQNLGYVISGTNRDGVYLVVQDKSNNLKYFLNVPPGQSAGYCDYDNQSSMPAACGTLPWIDATAPNNNSIQLFSPSANTTAATLESPLWFAAKWGGFIDKNGNGIPDLNLEWDADKNGIPDNYFLVYNPLKLKESLKKTFDNIVERSASAGNITSNGQEIRGGDRVFQSSFSSATWDGDLVAKNSSILAEVLWRASEKLPPEADRKIFTWKSGTSPGTEFTWNNVSTLFPSENVVNYIRGNQSNEIKNGGIYRSRDKLIGDIVHSSPYYVKDSNTVFVGANDGMLHAFNAETGVELFAYIPGLIIDKLADITSPFYSHKFYVDGDVAVSTRTQTSGKNILIGSPGRGAKGLFGLDVTDPANFHSGSRTDILWELAPDADLGFVLGRPQIGIANNNAAVAVVGNGYNSTNESSVLYVINLQTGAVVRKIDTGATGSNGLATPTLVDINGDGKFDYVYAGDHQGNVWKFDFRSATPAEWVLNSATPIFVARDAANKRQPITAKILVASNTLKDDANIGKTFLLFGTGSYYFQTDPNDKSAQSWYGLIDDGVAISSRAALRQRTINLVSTLAGKTVRTFSTSTANDMDGKKGWYIDLKDPTARGERIITASQLIIASEPALLASSIIPVTDDPCMPEGSGFLNAVNAFTGAALTDFFFDISGDGSFTIADMINGSHAGSFDPGIGMPGEGVIIGDKLIVGGSSGKLEETKLKIGTKKTGRISWREIRLQ